MTRLGLAAALLALTPLAACSEEEPVDPWAAYTNDQQDWLRSQDVPAEDVRLAESTIAWGEGVCAVYEAGGDASDIWNELQDRPYRGTPADVDFRTDITEAKFFLCPDA